MSPPPGRRTAERCSTIVVRHIDAVRRDEEGGNTDGKHDEPDNECLDGCRHAVGHVRHGRATGTSGWFRDSGFRATQKIDTPNGKLTCRAT